MPLKNKFNSQSKNTNCDPTKLIQSNVPLHEKTWFLTGGPARFFCEPTNAEEFQTALAFAHTQNIETFMLGKGANILISDNGFDGLVIRLQLQSITHKIQNNNTALVTADAGVSMPDLIEYCLQNNLLGLEEFSGIPGTVGGSVYINLHYFEFLLEQFLLSAEIIHKITGHITSVTTDWFAFGYNNSALHKSDHYLVNATFKLKISTDIEIAHAKGRNAEIIRHREKRYPTKRTCGSFFRNFHDNEVTIESNGKKMIYVAYYLDKIGVKGQLQSGDACVSYQHANMIVNNGNATSANIIAVALEMQKKVQNSFNIIPHPECQLIGFKKYPLLKNN